MPIKIAIAIVLLMAIPSHACYSPNYYNQDLKIFRAYATRSSEDFPNVSRDKAENLLLWQKEAGAEIPVKDITGIVYDSTLDQLRQLKADSSNQFANWLLNHKEAYDCLLLSKEVEEIRAEMIDDWYYPYEGDEYHNRLRTLLPVAKDGMKGKYGARYAVQAARILRALDRNSELEGIWNYTRENFPKSVLRRMVADYAAGAYEKLGNADKAMELYRESENIPAVSKMAAPFPKGSWQEGLTPKIKSLAAVFRVWPNHPSLKEEVRKIVNLYEDRISAASEWEFVRKQATWKRGDEVEGIDTFRGLRLFAEHAALDRRVEDPGLWFYTAAFLHYLDGNDARSAALLSRAEKARSNPDVKDAIRAFRILFDIQTKNPSAWINSLPANLAWLDSKMKGEVAPGNLNLSCLESGWTISYWVDASRKICETAANRLEKHGHHKLSLMVSNRGLYRPVQLAGMSVDTGSIDFSNPFFQRMDEIYADRAADYATAAMNPSTPLERFLTQGGNVGKDYLCEHVGTMYLREMNYTKAAEWLRKVSPDYQRTTNVYYYMRLDPFKWLDRDIAVKDRSNYKLRFAEQMADLESKMRGAKSADERADAKIRFAMGLRNSFGRCWALTRYMFYGYPEEEDNESVAHSGSQRMSQFRSSFKRDKNAQKAYARADKLIAAALKEYRTPERAAQAMLEMKNFKTVVSRYPKSKAADYVRGHCDRYNDYALQKW